MKPTEIQSPANRADMLLMGMLDRYFTNHSVAMVAQLWQANRPLVNTYVKKHLGPLMESPTISGPAAAYMQVMEGWVEQRGDFMIRAAWGRFKPAIAALIEREVSARAA